MLNAKLLVLGLAVVTTLCSAKEFTTVCIVRELDESKIPSQIDGVIRELDVRRGHAVEKKQRIALIDYRDASVRLAVAHAERELAEVRAQNTGPLIAAESQLLRSREELMLTKELGVQAIHLERFRAENSVKRFEGELRAAENQLSQDASQVQVESRKIDLIEFEISQATINSPYIGQIREVPVDLGEWVSKGQTIAVVTRMDRLLVEGFLPSEEIPPHLVTGAVADVEFRLADEVFRLPGLVVQYTSPSLELDGKYSVWLEIDNQPRLDQRGEKQWLIRPNMNGKMTLTIRDAGTKR